MELFRPSASMNEPATYRISIQGTMDKKWSDHYGGMTIEHERVLDQNPVTILTGLMAGDLCVGWGVINTLYDFGYPLLLVECVEAR